MRRREFIAALGGAAAMPLVARAQQDRLRRVQFLHGLAEHDQEAKARVAAFREALEILGWIEGRNITVDHRFSGGDIAQIHAQAEAAISSAPDVIAASGSPVIAALKRRTRAIPIVFSVVNDPAGQGFVESLSRPGANITGFSYIDFPMIGKWIELLKDIAPGVRRITLMFNPQTAPFYPAFLRDFGANSAAIGVVVAEAPVLDAAQINAALTALSREPAVGLIAAPDPFINTQRGLIIELAQQHRIPTLFGFRQHAKDGGLMSYGPDSIDIVRRSASYVDRILKGEKPADLPVQAPTKYELAINLKTAMALGLTVPPALLARADEVIE